MNSVENPHDLPDDFQMTELGPLPQEWQVVRLGEVFDITQGKSLSAKQNKGIRPRPFLRTSNVYWGYLDLSKLDVMDFTEEEEQKFALQPGDLLVCEGGDVGRTAMWAGQMQGIYYQNHLHRLRARDNNVNPAFVMYWLQTAFTLLNLYSGSSNKTTIPNLSQGRLAVFPIPLPPLPEQRAIAHVLRTVQRAKEATEGVIAALKELKKSLMQHLFTYGPVPVTERERVPLQETEIGPIPAHWRVVRLGEVGKVVRGASPRPKGDPRYFGGTIPRLMVEDVTRDYKYVIPRIDFLTVEGAKLSRFLPKGTVVIQVSGNPGTPAILGVDACIHDGFAAIQELDINKIAAEFLFYWLDQTKQRHKRLAFGAVFQNLQTYAIRDFVIPLPPLDEQREIARMLQAVDAKIAAEERRRAALEELFKTLLHALMSGRIRVPNIVGGQRSRDSAPNADPLPESED